MLHGQVIGLFLTYVRAHELFDVCEESEDEQSDRKLDDVAWRDDSSDARCVHDQPVGTVGDSREEGKQGLALPATSIASVSGAATDAALTSAL